MERGIIKEVMKGDRIVDRRRVFYYVWIGTWLGKISLTRNWRLSCNFVFLFVEGLNWKYWVQMDVYCVCDFGCDSLWFQVSVNNNHCLN
jgi:hypothetical protein